jgi:alginate production protein
VALPVSARRLCWLVIVLALAPAAAAAEEVEKDDPWQRLTEREDKRRPLEPLHVEVAERPLTLGGEWELELGYLRRRLLRESSRQPDRLALEQGLELEAFYSFGSILSLFSQIRLAQEEDLLSDSFESVSDYYVERGEMWLYSEDIAGTHLNFDVGRLDFEDERRWWWDDELDAVRVGYETESFEVTLAAARELAPNRSDQSRVDPEQERVFRLIGEAGWDWDEAQSVELFFLYQDDHSRREEPGEVVSAAREDDADARLTWLGARAMGVIAVGSRHYLGYWADVGGVFGEERLADFADLPGGESVVDEVLRHDVRGWGLDVGASWIFELSWEPRVFAGYAFGSGDGSPGSGTDRAYRQTGVEANEAGFGGVERFPSYGLVLDPELSNLGILTVGAGIEVLRSSSLDLVYHYYRLVEPADELRDARLEAELDGQHRSLGHGFDLVLALEEWERFETDLALAAFRTDNAFGEERGRWSWGAFFALRFAF